MTKTTDAIRRAASDTEASGIITQRLVELLQEAGYAVHVGEADDRPDLGQSANWFTWGAPGMADCEFGDGKAAYFGAWLAAAEHWFANAAIQMHKMPETSAAGPLLDTEIATILAGLRCFQQVRDQCGGDIPDDLADVATNGGTLEALDTEEIDALCERLNLGEVGATVGDRFPGLLQRCEAFIAGFEGDDSQDDPAAVDSLLADLRAVIEAKPAPLPEAPKGHSVLIDELQAYCKAEGLPLGSADELAASGAADERQAAWLREYVNRWDRWSEYRHALAEACGPIADAEGWGLFNDNRDLQRDNEADRFASDEDAQAYVRRMAAAGSPVHAYALELWADGRGA